MIHVYIGLGSNLAQPLQQLQSALTSLGALPNTILIQASSFYASQPMGPQDQPDYVNGVVLLETELEAHTLLRHTQLIETQHGRERHGQRWGPRTLDLDILLYGQHQISSEELVVPHYGMREREFVLYPLFEIAPELVLPNGEKLVDWINDCPKNGLRNLNSR